MKLNRLQRITGFFALATLPVLSLTTCTLDTPSGLYVLTAPFRDFEIEFDDDEIEFDFDDDDDRHFGGGGFFDLNFGYDDGYYDNGYYDDGYYDDDWWD